MPSTTTRTILLACLALTACGAPGGPPLVSAQFPPAMGSNSEPQPIDSLPPGAANLSTAPNATHPDYLAYTFGRR